MSVREFQLFDHVNNKYLPLNDVFTTGLLIDPKGLGASFKADILKDNEYTIINNLVNDTQEFSCVIVFNDYKKYQDYLLFVNSQTLELLYTMPEVNKIFRQRVKLVDTEKTEKTSGGKLPTNNTFLAETPWFVNVKPTSGIGQVLDRAIEYKSGYGQYITNETGNTFFRMATRQYTSGLTGYGTGMDGVQTTFQFFLKNITLNPIERPIPFRVEIKGPCENPKWTLLKGGAEYINAEFILTLTDKETLIVDSLPTGEQATKYNEDTGIYENVWLTQTIEENYEPYMKMFQGDNVLTFKFKDDVVPPTSPIITVYETSIVV